MALGLYPDGGQAVERYDHMIDEIADFGASDIALVVTWAQRDIRSTSIAAGKESIDDATLRHAITHARKRGLRVLVFPILTVRKLRPGQWRGTLQPADIDTWWQAYETFILHYADIAAKSGAESLLIGSELATTELWMYRWYHLISQVRRVYDGSLVYSANWDHFQLVSFWRRLDVIGVNGYFRLTDNAEADVSTLRAAWSDQRERIADYLRDKGKAFWMTEVGYTSVDGTATRPWDYQRKGRIDHEEQRRCFQAFTEVWDGAPELDGVFVWNWWGRGGAKDRGYTPKNKPAGKVLRNWYRGAP